MRCLSVRVRAFEMIHLFHFIICTCSPLQYPGWSAFLGRKIKKDIIRRPIIKRLAKLITARENKNKHFIKGILYCPV